MVAAIAPRPDSPPSQTARPRLYVIPGGRPPRPRRRHAHAVYRRRRVVVLVALVGVVLGLGLAVRAVAVRVLAGPAVTAQTMTVPTMAAPTMAAGPAGGPAPSRPVASHLWIVRPGDTLWAIALATGDKGDIRSLVDRLSAEVHGQPLQPGERIVLP